MEEIQVARCIVRSKNRHLLLLIRRANDDRHSPGMWECPGGKVDLGDDLYQTLEKEVSQETKLEVLVRQEEQFVEVDRNEMTEGLYAGKTYVCHFVIALEEAQKPVVLSEEHSACAWVSFNEALDYDLTPQTRKGLVAFADRLKTPFG